MMDQPSFEREINAYLIKVDGILKGKGLLNDKGSAKLNMVQSEVDLTLDKLRAMQRQRRLTRVVIGKTVNASLNRVETISNQILDGVSVPLGSVFGNLSNDSMLSNPAWKDAFSQVSLQISNFTNTYGTLISNMDSVTRIKIDKALASIIDDAKECFKMDSSAGGASKYLAKSLRALTNLESAAQSQQTVSSAAMLKLVVQEKDQERVRLLSQMKLAQRDLTPEQISVVNDASRRIMEKLNDMLEDKNSYDAAIRNKKLQLIKSDLDIMRSTMQNVRFKNNLGRSLPPPRNNGTRLGFLNKNKLRQPFRSALASNLGGGTGVVFKEVDLTAAETTPYDILETVKHNTTVIKAQGGIDTVNRPTYLRQVNSLTQKAFGNDIVALKEAQKYYRRIASSGLSGMSMQQIKDKHPRGTKQSHIKRMHEHMQEGMEFGPAHKKAVKEGFPAGNLGGIFTYDQPQESLINGVRLLGSIGLYLVIPSLLIYGVGSAIAKKNSIVTLVRKRLKEEE
jgi:hypothetical protein